jgi:hypothetical protein
MCFTRHSTQVIELQFIPKGICVIGPIGCDASHNGAAKRQELDSIPTKPAARLYSIKGTGESKKHCELTHPFSLIFRLLYPTETIDTSSESQIQQ